MCSSQHGAETNGRLNKPVSTSTLLYLNWNIVIIPLVQRRLAIIPRQMMWKSNKKLFPWDPCSWPNVTGHEGYELLMYLQSAVQVVKRDRISGIDLQCLKGIWLNKWQHMVDEKRSEWRSKMLHCFQKEGKGWVCWCRERGVCASFPSSIFRYAVTLAVCF